jgi:hypothetical protein
LHLELSDKVSEGLASPCVLVFDELLHYPGWEANEALALWEWWGCLYKLNLVDP